MNRRSFFGTVLGVVAGLCWPWRKAEAVPVLSPEQVTAEWTTLTIPASPPTAVSKEFYLVNIDDEYRLMRRQAIQKVLDEAEQAFWGLDT